MAPGQSYHGPLNMADSRYASPQARTEVESILASDPELKERMARENFLAIQKHLEAVAAENECDGLKIARDQKAAIQQMLKEHVREVERTTSTVKATIRHHVSLIRDAIKAGQPKTADAALQKVENLWKELEKLFAVTEKAKEAAPMFVEKQNENTQLIVAAKLDETHNDHEAQLQGQEKRLKVLHELNLGQQQAYHDIKASLGAENNELKELLKRLQLDQGSLKTELDRAKVQLTTTQEAHTKAAKAAEDMQKQIDSLNESKNGLSKEKSNLQDAVNGLEKKLKAAEEKATVSFKKEIDVMTDKLYKEEQKATALDTHLKGLRQTQEKTMKELEKAKSEYNNLSEKYKNQSGVFAKASEDHKVLAKKTAALEDETRKLQQQKADLQKERDSATSAKENLHKQCETLKTELDDMRQKLEAAREEAKQFSEKLEATKKQSGELETENKDLRAKQLKHNNVIALLKKAEAENATLRVTIQNLQQAPPPPPPVNDSTDVTALKDELQALQQQLVQSEAMRKHWESFGEVLNKRNEEAKTRSQELKAAKKQVSQLQEKNNTLQAKLDDVTVAQASELGAKYWRDQYETLLADMEG